jgi:hypothetical protein
VSEFISQHSLSLLFSCSACLVWLRFEVKTLSHLLKENCCAHSPAWLGGMLSTYLGSLTTEFPRKTSMSPSWVSSWPRTIGSSPPLETQIQALLPSHLPWFGNLRCPLERTQAHSNSGSLSNNSWPTELFSQTLPCDHSSKLVSVTHISGASVFFVYGWYWGLNSGPSPWATPPALFLWRVFQDRVSWTICLGWIRTAILLISASWVARITGVSYRHLARSFGLHRRVL